MPFFVRQYGFCEGHTAYQADPAAIAFIVGLKCIAEIEPAFSGRLRAGLAGHFTAQTP